MVFSSKQIKKTAGFLRMGLALAAAASALTLFSGCEALAPGQMSDIRQDTYQTKMSVDDIKRSQSQSLRRMEDMLSEVDKKLADQDQFLRTMKEDLQKQINDMQGQMKTAQPAGPMGTYPGAAPGAGGLPAMPTATPSQEEVDAFSAADADVQAKNYDSAIPKLEQFISQYSTSQKAPEATYKLGQAYFEKGDAQKAQQAFDRVVTQFPTSNIIPQSLHARAVAEIRLNQNEQARATLERLKSTYPDYQPQRIDEILKTVQ